MRNHTTLVVCLIAALSVSSRIEAVEYGNTLAEAFRTAVGPQITPWKKDFRRLHCYSYPTNSFGILTLYTKKSNDFLCADWSCIDKMPPTKRDLSMDGIADYGVGAPLNLSEEKERELALGVVIPTVAKIVGISLGADFDKKIDYEIRLGPGYIRRVKPREFESYFRSLPGEDFYRRKFNDGDLIVGVMDFVVDGISVSIEVDKTTGADLGVELNTRALEWLGSEPEADASSEGSEVVVNLSTEAGESSDTTDDAAESENNGGNGEGTADSAPDESDDGIDQQKDLYVDFRKTVIGSYKMELDKPLVLCTLFKKMKGGGRLLSGGEVDFQDMSWWWSELADSTSPLVDGAGERVETFSLD